MTVKQTHDPANVGDWLEVQGPAGKPARRGQVVEVLGEVGHERYRVRWDERHESIFFPSSGVVTVVRRARPRASRKGGGPVRG